MSTDDRTLLIALKKAVDAAAQDGQAAQVRALHEVLEQYNATMADVVRVLHRAKARRAMELGGLAQRISALADSRDDATSTADAVDDWLRSLAQS